MNLPPGPGPDQKRPRKSGVETPTLARDLLPKPANPNPNGGSPMSTMASSPPTTTSQKKRGRPSKADVERKQREAIERGEIITPASQSPAGMPGPDDSRSGYAPVTILPAPPGPRETAMGSMSSNLSPRAGSFPQMGMGHDPPASIGAEPPGKKRRPRPPPKPKVRSLVDLLRLLLTRRRSKSQVYTSFQLMHQLDKQDKEKPRPLQFQRTLHRLFP
jgi:hypothetical protein